MQAVSSHMVAAAGNADLCSTRVLPQCCCCCQAVTYPDGLLYPPNELTLWQGTHKINIRIPIVLLALKLSHPYCDCARSMLQVWARTSTTGPIQTLSL